MSLAISSKEVSDDYVALRIQHNIYIYICIMSLHLLTKLPKLVGWGLRTNASDIHYVFSCIWHNSTMLQIISCRTYSKKEVYLSQWLEQLSSCLYSMHFAKILEKLVLSHVSSELNTHNPYNTCQSAYRPSHSTESDLPLLLMICSFFIEKAAYLS